MLIEALLSHFWLLKETCSLFQLITDMSHPAFNLEIWETIFGNPLSWLHVQALPKGGILTLGPFQAILQRRQSQHEQLAGGPSKARPAACIETEAAMVMNNLAVLLR